MRPAPQALTLGELVGRLGGDLRGDPSLEVCRVAPLETAGPDAIAFFGSEVYRASFLKSRAGVVIVPSAVERPEGASIASRNPHAYFIRVVESLYPESAAVPSIHPQAWVHPEAHIAASAEIGAFASVERGAWIGERVKMGPGCRIGEEAQIGDDSRLHANVVVYAHCIVGKRAVLNAGCVIGGDGFGGVLEEGRWLKMPHLGRVVIGDEVEVGANTTIDRGAMDDTVIADGVKLDNQIQIAHNVYIGKNTTVAACAGIAGSAHIGANCIIGGNSSISGHLSLADGVYISPATMIGRSIDTPGRYSGIFPWSEHRTWLKIAAALRRLGVSAAEGRRRSGESPNRGQEDPS